MNNEIRPLTSLRMIAALLVYLHHFGGIPYGVVVNNFFLAIQVEGHIGVPIFFVLSGFLITLRYYRDLNHRAFSFKSYFIKRAARIYPLYFFVLICVLVYNSIPALTVERIVNWTITQGFFANLKFTVIPTAWSLTVEESFYFLAPLIYLSLVTVALSNGKTHWRGVALRFVLWAGGAFALGLIVVTVANATGLAAPAGFMATNLHMVIYTIFGHMFDFLVGIVCAIFYLQHQQSKMWNRPNGTTIATMLTAFSLALMGLLAYLVNQAGGVFVTWYYIYPLAILSGTLILSLTCPNSLFSRILSHDVPVYMGRISYALYLVQYTFFTMDLIPYLNSVHPLFPVVFYGASNVVSMGLYELVEKPGRTLILSGEKNLPRFLKLKSPSPAKIVEQSEQV